MITQLSTTLVQLVDTMFIGRIGPLALGAAAVTGIIIFNITAVGDGFSTGLVAAVSRMIGQKDRKSAEIFSTTGIFFLTLLGFLLTPLLLASSGPLFSILQVPEDLRQTAWEYYGTFITFVPAIFAFTALSASFRARGDTKTPMWVGFGINVINIILDYLLIFGKFGIPALGVAGAALASGISFVAGALFLALIATKSSEGLLRIKRSRFSLSHLRRIVKIAIPSTIERAAMSFSQLLIMSLTVNPLGSLAIASFHIVMRLASLSFMPGFGFSMATATLVGQHLGAKDPDGADRMIWTGTIYCGLLMLVISFSYFAFPEFLVSLFSSSPEIIAETSLPLRIYAILAVFLAPAMTIRGGLQGAGDTAFTMKVMLVSRFIIRLPFAWLLGNFFNLGLPGVWFAMCSDFIIRGVVFAIYARKGKWKNIKV